MVTSEVESLRRQRGHAGGAPIRDTGKDHLSPSSKDTAGGQLLTNQEEGAHQTSNLPAPRPWTFQPPEPREITVGCLCRPVYGIWHGSLD